MTSTPRVYIADLAAYNSGILHGKWVDADDADILRDEIAVMLRQSPCPNVMVSCPECDRRAATVLFASSYDKCSTCDGSGMVPSAEEWAIHDYEGFGAIADMLDESPDINTLAHHANMIVEHGDAWIAYVNDVHIDFANEEDFSDHYAGEYDSEADYAEEVFEDIFDIPENLRYYIDYVRIARDLGFDGYRFINSGHGTVYVFSPS